MTAPRGRFRVVILDVLVVVVVAAILLLFVLELLNATRRRKFPLCRCEPRCGRPPTARLGRSRWWNLWSETCPGTIACCMMRAGHCRRDASGLGAQ